MTTATAEMTVNEIDGRQTIDRASGALVEYRRFNVQRAGHDAHVVEIEVSHSGAPQHESCDCRGFQFRHTCAHVTAVYEAGVLSADAEA